jgi:tetratricopeptide (TPR) repeat protein
MTEEPKLEKTERVADETTSSPEKRRRRKKSSRKPSPKSVVLKRNVQWFFEEIAKIFHSPVGVAGGFLEAIRGWKFSRNWMSVWLNLPAAVLIATIFAIFSFSNFQTEDGQLQQLLVIGEEKCSTSTLESLCDQIDEDEFTKALGESTIVKAKEAPIQLGPLTLKYVELLSKRVLDIEAADFRGLYRLALVHFLTDQKSLAMTEMNQLASISAGAFPQANAWLARRMVASIESSPGSAEFAASTEKIKPVFEKAFEWKNLDPRLMLAYAKILEKGGDLQRAIVVTKRAASMKPEANLDLARLYARAGNADGLRESSYAVEDHFGKKLNTPLEQESDRLAVAEAKRLSNKPLAAIEVLKEGLMNKDPKPKLQRELSEVYLQMYRSTIESTEPKSPSDKVKWKVDFDALQKVVEADPTNPNFSLEVARLLPIEVTPTKPLLDSLKKQMQSGVTTSGTYILLAEEQFKQNKVKEAIKFWEIAIKQDPTNYLAINNLALVLAKDQPSNLDRPFEMLNQAVEAQPDNPELYDSLGELYLLANRPKDAINKLEKAIKLDQNRINTREMLVKAYKAADMEDMAQVQLRVIATIQSAQEANSLPPASKSNEE